MRAEFEEMPGDSRLWVYQANRPLSKEEVSLLNNITSNFVDQWQAHGKSLRASYEVRFDQFLILAVDESYNGATGCSIDSSVQLIRTLEQELSLSFLDRSKVALLQEDKVALEPLAELKNLASQGTLTKSTVVFNNSVASLDQYRELWMVPAGDSWLKRYFR